MGAKVKKILIYTILLTGCLLFNNCASTKKTKSAKYKKIQPGKPIPCPTKDCD